MKRFAWPLQRYLDVVAQREEAMKARVGLASSAVVAARVAIRRRKRALADTLLRIAGEPGPRRLADQRIAVGCEPAERRAIEAMSAELAQLEARRKELLAQLRDLRARREMLEKLREEARAEYLRQVELEERKLHDQTSQIAFVRRSALGLAGDRSMTA